MTANKIIGTVLIIGSLVLGYIGVDHLMSSESAIRFGGLEIKAQDEARERQGYIYTGCALVLFAGGVYIIGKK
ncbi:MAG: hypothetical protein ACNS60_16765 [Candidatus Cyclobacteriaceae bacterium M2_1C_046]